MIMELKNQEQKYFKKLQGLSTNHKEGQFDFINQTEENQFDMDRVMFDKEGRQIMIKEIQQDD